MSITEVVALAAGVPWMATLLGFLVAAAAVRLLSPLAIRTGWVDKPNFRKIHEGEVPVIGGWAVFIALVVVQIAIASSARAPLGYWLGVLLLFVVALVDDRHPIRARYRFAVQLAAAVAGVSFGGQVLPELGDLAGGGNISAWWIVAPVSIIGLVALINAMNFSDGADGLCGGLGFISLFWLLFVLAMSAGMTDHSEARVAAHALSLFPLTAGMIGALAGFLLFNLRTPWRGKATVFLGDSGSTVIGFTLAWLAIHVCSAYGTAGVRPVVCLWIMAVPLADSASCIVRRILAGETPMSADLKHLHHLLFRSGLTVRQAVFSMHVGSFACGMAGVSLWLLEVPERWIFAAFVAALAVFVCVSNLAWRRIEHGPSLDRVVVSRPR